MNTQAIIEGIKEVARLALFAVISVVLAWGSEKLAGLDPSSAWVIGGTLVLRFLDKWIHENQSISATGISPF